MSEVKAEVKKTKTAKTDKPVKIKKVNGAVTFTVKFDSDVKPTVIKKRIAELVSCFYQGDCADLAEKVKFGAVKVEVEAPAEKEEKKAE